MAYKHLSEPEREHIYELKQRGQSLASIGAELGRHKGTISRELSRSQGGPRRYSPHAAHREAQRRRRERPIECKLDRSEISQEVRSGLAKRWSPEQISARITRDHGRQSPLQVSRQSIYRWLSRNNEERRCFRGDLRHGPYRRRGAGPRRIPIANRVSLKLRPPEVATRQRTGDWEATPSSAPSSRDTW